MLKRLCCIFLILPFLCFGKANDITLVTMAIGKQYLDLVKPSIPNKKEYCKKYGYNFFVGYENLDSLRPPPWSKVLYILKIMEDPNVKWVFWSDADSLIMRYDIELETFIDENYNIIIAQGFNSGEFFIRNCNWSKDLLRMVYAKNEYIHHHLWENIALVKVLEEKPSLLQYIKQVPMIKFNSLSPETCIMYPEVSPFKYEKGDFIIHFAALRDNHLKETILKYVNKVEK
jgi:hypothetical protein